MAVVNILVTRCTCNKHDTKSSLPIAIVYSACSTDRDSQTPGGLGRTIGLHPALHAFKPSWDRMLAATSLQVLA